MMKKLLLLLLTCLVLSGCRRCGETEYNLSKRNDEDAVTSAVDDVDDKAIVVEEVKSPYINNSLDTGDTPYECLNIEGNESAIIIKTAESSESDVVAIIKSDEQMVANSYIQAGDSFTFNLPNGNYQVFFYSGQGWDPSKIIQKGKVGGFVTNESYTKDDPVTLDNQELTYELILQKNGNFSAKPSNADEVF